MPVPPPVIRAWRPSSDRPCIRRALAEPLGGGKAARMKLAILETGRPPAELATRFGDYPAMLRELLGAGFEAESFAVAAGELPADPSAFDGYLITGSPAGVYDGFPWIDDLLAFICSA